MVLAEIGLAELFLTMIEIWFLFMCIWIFIALVSDLLRDHEISGGAKAGWLIVLVAFPLLGLLIYVIVRGQGMAERSMAAQLEAKEAFDSYVKETAGSGAADEISKLAELRASGAIDDSEFARLKAKVVG